jgi:hypothetical protein
VDSNVLLDIMTEDPRWFLWSAKALANAAETPRLVITATARTFPSCGSSRLGDNEKPSQSGLQIDPIRAGDPSIRK